MALNHPCEECEFDRLKRWAVSSGIVSAKANAAELVTSIIKLTQNMHERISTQTSQLEQLIQSRSNARMPGTV
jgi:hypothetical protein